MTDHQTKSEREEIELMLPWYETGQLDAEEMSRVEAYLAKDAELRERLALVREESAETITANESLGMPRVGARDRLMAQIAAEAGPPRKAGQFSSLIKRFSHGTLSPGLALGGALAALVIIVQAAVLVSVINYDPRDGGPQLASGQETVSQTGTFALIRFQNNANAQDIAGLLRASKAVIVDGPKPGGMFRIRISPETLSEQDRDALLASFRERADLVAFITSTR